jgi:lysozyme
LEAGRKLNIASGGDWHVDVTNNFIVNAGRNGTLSFDGDVDIHSSGALKIQSTDPLHLKGKSIYATSANDLNLVAGTTMYQTASTDINILATKNIIQNAVVISVNSAPGTAGTTAKAAATASGIPTQELPGTSVLYPWINDNFYKGKNIDSIMNRVPMHEPWDQHENINPVQFNSTATDVTNRTGFGTSSRPSVASSVDYAKAPNVQGNPPSPTGNTKLDNMAAFLWMIRVCEGTSSADGYRVMFTRKLFDISDSTLPSYQYKDHPNIANRGGGITSTAAGAYQFLYSTWKECQKALNLPDFSPLSQDKACIYLLKRRRAIDDIETGNFTSAINKCNREWASLPGSPYDQNPKPINIALALYKQAGGTFVA